MRLDMFLKTSRLVKRRPVAKELCDDGRVLVSGQRSKPGREVKPGDEITLKLHRRRVVVEVVTIPRGNVSKAAAQELYRVVEDTPATEDDLF